MRHLKKTVKLGRKAEARKALLAGLAVSLIQRGRVTTTLAKAKALRPFAEKLVTLAKKGTLHHRRLAVTRVRDKRAVRKLFQELAPRFGSRPGGYTRIVKLWHRKSDAARLALIEWVEAGMEPREKKEAKSSVAAAS
jgi:large subunit ribosomal protein L17